MDWLCPGYSSVLGAQITKHHGNITAVNTIRDITAITQTGDLHIAIYDVRCSFVELDALPCFLLHVLPMWPFDTVILQT